MCIELVCDVYVCSLFDNLHIAVHLFVSYSPSLPSPCITFSLLLFHCDDDLFSAGMHINMIINAANVQGEGLVMFSVDEYHLFVWFLNVASVEKQFLQFFSVVMTLTLQVCSPQFSWRMELSSQCIVLSLQYSCNMHHEYVQIRREEQFSCAQSVATKGRLGYPSSILRMYL